MTRGGHTPSTAEPPLVETKLSRPRSRANVVARPRLLRALDELADTELTLVSAPVGGGKSLLVAAWCDARPDAAVAWISLDAADDDRHTPLDVPRDRDRPDPSRAGAACPPPPRPLRGEREAGRRRVAERHLRVWRARDPRPRRPPRAARRGDAALVRARRRAPALQRPDRCADAIRPADPACTAPCEAVARGAPGQRAGLHARGSAGVARRPGRDRPGRA